MTITGKEIKTAEKNRSLFRLPLAFGPIQQSASHNGGLEGGGVAVSSKGRGRGLFLRRGRLGRRFCRFDGRGRLLEVEVLQGHVQGHDLNAAHGLEVGEVPQRAVAVVFVLGGGGGVLVGQQRGEQQFRHEQAPVGPLGLARLPLRLGQPRFAQPEETERHDNTVKPEREMFGCRATGQNQGLFSPTC